MVTQQELTVQEQQAQAIASQPIPRRRFGTRVTAQTQQQVIQQKQQAQKQVQEIRIEKQRQEQIRQQQLALEQQSARAQQDYQDYLVARKLASSGRPVPLRELTPRQREIFIEIREGLVNVEKYKEAVRQAEFRQKVYESQQASGQPFTPAYQTPTSSTYIPPSFEIKQYQTYREAPASFTPEFITRKETEQRAIQFEIARQQEQQRFEANPTNINELRLKVIQQFSNPIDRQNIIERYQKFEKAVASRTTQPFSRYIYERTGLSAERIGEAPEGVRGIGSPVARRFIGGFAQGVIEDIRDRPVKNVILFGAGYGVSLALKGTGAILGATFPKVLPTVEKGIGLGGIALTGFYSYKVGTQIYYSENIKEAGKIAGVETKNLVLIGSGARLGTRSFERISDYFRTLGLREVPSENIIAREYFAGQTYPEIRRGQTAGQLQKEFYQPIQVIKETNIESAVFTASPQTFAKQITTGKGSSELFGLYSAPRLSAKFLGTGQGGQSGYSLFSFKGALEFSRPTALRTEIKVELIPQVKPSQSNILKLNDRIKRLFGGGYKRDFGEPILERGKAYIPFVKTEKEAIIPFDTVLNVVQKRFFFKFEGRRVPIFQAKVSGAEVVEQEVLTVAEFSTRYGARSKSYLNPINIQLSQIYSSKSMKQVNPNYLLPSSSKSYINIRSSSIYLKLSSRPSISPPSNPSISSPPSSPPISSGSYSPPRVSPPSSPPRYPPIRPPRAPPPSRPPRYPRSISGKGGDNFVRGYLTFIKSLGKKIYIGAPAPRGIALARGIRATTRGRTSLSATFGIERAGVIRGSNDNLKQVNKKLFREFRIVRGKQIYTPDTFIQRREKRLSTKDERRRIQEARRLSKRR